MLGKGASGEIPDTGGAKVSGAVAAAGGGATGVGTEVRIREIGLALVQQVVHLPELPLGAGGLGGFGCLLRVRVRGRDSLGLD